MYVMSLQPVGPSSVELCINHAMFNTHAPMGQPNGGGGVSRVT